MQQPIPSIRDVPALVELAATRDPELVALESGEGALTFAELAAAVRDEAAALDRGPAPVVVRHADPVRMVTAALGALAAARPVLLLDHRLPDAAAHDLTRRAVEGCAGAGGPEPAEGWGTILATSGSTGGPKLVVRRRSADLAAALCLPLAGFPLARGTRLWMPIPVASAGFLSLVLGAVVAGSTVRFAPFDAARAGEDIEEAGIDVVYLVPTMIRLGLGGDGLEGRGWDRLRALYWAGESLDGDTASVLRDRFTGREWVAYGATEVPTATLATPRDREEAPGTVGRRTPLHAVRVVDGDRRPVAPGREGEVELSGADMFDRYLGGPGGGDPWYPTGDLGHLDGEGRLFVTGRRTQLVKVGGNRVSPEESAAVLRRVPGVAAAAVVAVPDPVWGHRLHGFVVEEERGACDPGALEQACRRYLPAAKVPRVIEVVDELPLTLAGKIDLARLQERAVRDR